MWGTIRAGGVVLRETISAVEGSNGLVVEGQESFPPSPVAFVRATRDRVRGLVGKTVPVLFSDKNQLTGYYMVRDSSATLVDEQNGEMVSCNWSMTLERIGSGTDVEMESRVPTIARATDVANPAAASFWHSPPGATRDYFTGSTVPSSVFSRSGSEGIIPVYAGMPTDVAPRWTVLPASYMLGSARLTVDGQYVSGEVTPPHTEWVLSNSLIDIRKGLNGALDISTLAADGARRSIKALLMFVNIVVLNNSEMTVLKNEPGEVTIRLSYPAAPGRTTVDLTLRRGARFVTGVIKRHSSATLGVGMFQGNMSSVPGGLRETNADANSNRFVIGSAKPGGPLGQDSMQKGSVTVLDFFAGHEIGTSPQVGDAYADLWAQYRGTAGETVKAVRR